jgi:ATPase subunit of ABC transporter with duplicated ATPase domains
LLDEHSLFGKFDLIQFKDLTLVRGVKVLIEGASFQLHPGHKVGLTGANGAGKSSLFAMLRGELQSEHGDLEMPPEPERLNYLMVWVLKMLT